MNNSTREKLIRELQYLQQYGTRLSVLFVTARGTSCGLVVGVDDGAFTVSYVKAGWLDFLGPKNFRSFCDARGLRAERERWGKERAIQTRIGADVSKAIDTIDGCFDAVYGISGEFGLLLNGYGWRAPGGAKSDAS
jgi:hypothetical protein